MLTLTPQGDRIMQKNIADWTVICYGNILRSQVLEQYLRHYIKIHGIDLNINSAGVAHPNEFPDTEVLLSEIAEELDSRSIEHDLERTPWGLEVEKHIIGTDKIICADNNVKSTVIDRMNGKIDHAKISTFYESINEGETDFEDTYDYENKRQDPIRFAKAFDELERIAKKMLSTLTDY